MNRSTQARPSHTITYLIVIVTFLVIAYGGIRHAIYKNRQVRVAREIDAAERRIDQCQLDIRDTQIRSETMLRRFAIRDRLRECGSKLRPIPAGLAEDVDPAATPPAVATTLP